MASVIVVTAKTAESMANPMIHALVIVFGNRTDRRRDYTLVFLAFKPNSEVQYE